MTTVTQCLGRLVKDDDRFRGLFADGHKFHHEIRCERIADGDLCKGCQEKQSRRDGNHPTRLHGLISEAIPEWSHIFGGDWYNKRLPKYGAPSDMEMVKAKAAQEKARKSVKTSAPETIVAPTQVAAEPAQVAEEPKKKRVYKKKIVIVNEIPEVETKPKTKSKAKDLAIPAEVVIAAVESKEAPLEPTHIVRVKVSLMNIDGHPYFLDPIKNKLYNVASDKRPGRYHGRWNPTGKKIDTTFPDSDAE